MYRTVAIVEGTDVLDALEDPALAKLANGAAKRLLARLRVAYGTYEDFPPQLRVVSVESRQD